MKKIATVLISLALFAFSALADDRPIDYEQLPSAAKTFIQSDFPSLQISFITKDPDLVDTTYDVHFSNGLIVEFNSKGEWKEISCNTEAIADKYVPEKILSTISKRWPSAEVRKIERYRQGYELELSNRLELKFNKQCKLVEIDD